jgi:hypothetical protein
MFAILNKSERLITTHLGDMLPPGLPVAVSEVTMEHPSMQALANGGVLEVVEIQDPPPDTVNGGNGDTTGGALSRDTVGGGRVGGGVQQPPSEPVRINNPPQQQPRS